MKTTKQKLSIVFFALALVVMGWWISAGSHIFTTTEKLVQEKDELFGTTTQHWEKQFTPGLTMLGPIAGVLLIGGVLMLRTSKKTRQKLEDDKKLKHVTV
ncbi:MAG: hypothetical protein ABI444_07840 [Candidatus Kapaibacterium sp.]|jgi:hypothetical protein